MDWSLITIDIVWALLLEFRLARLERRADLESNTTCDLLYRVHRLEKEKGYARC